MKDPQQTPPITKNGLFKTLLKSAPTPENSPPKHTASRELLNEFHDNITMAKLHGVTDGEGIPHIEAPREIVEYFNDENLAGFDETGYFIYQGVKVYEIGKKDAPSARDKMTIEQKVFGNAK